jgi:hypothetical protein
MRAVSHTRPCPSIIGLWTSVRLVQIDSLPQYGDDWSGAPAALGVFASRGRTSTRLVVCRTGSSTGR